jgi:hypothetical protein
VVAKGSPIETRIEDVPTLARPPPESMPAKAIWAKAAKASAEGTANLIAPDKPFDPKKQDEKIADCWLSTFPIVGQRLTD